MSIGITSFARCAKNITYYLKQISVVTGIVDCIITWLSLSMMHILFGSIRLARKYAVVKPIIPPPAMRTSTSLGGKHVDTCLLYFEMENGSLFKA